MHEPVSVLKTIINITQSIAKLFCFHKDIQYETMDYFFGYYD